MALLEVSGDHIMRLDDKALRELVVRLCEAELRRTGSPWSALTAGGHQDAPDGGVDVRVALLAEASAASPDFIPRPDTVFQCKATNMRVQDITREMKPKGNLRPAIQDLIQKRGAYVIVSSRSTATDTALNDRLDAMRRCVADIEGAEALLLRFDDRTSLTRWASQFPGVCAWVREQVGQSIDGWRGHGEWAAPRDGHTPYVADAHPRLWAGVDQQAPRPVADGLRELRAHLASERGVVRLVGLSGTGKTRLAQALFERDLAPDSALDPAIALYADLADDGRGRLAFLTRLRSDGLRAIVVLDNCPPAQHRQFADLCGGEGSRMSLLTLNLDVQDDQPEGTQVFRLEAASVEVTARIIRQEPNSAPLAGDACRRIAELAGGNARLALALARSVPKGTLAKFSNADLFNRLFHQSRARNDALLHVARACALVYSFNGGSGGDISEVAVLAGWAFTDAGTLCTHVAELHRRGLVQRRDVWCALLPQALALHLAREALEGLLPHVLEQSLRQAPPRLMRSFTRQLGLLHDSPQAQALVKQWLAPGGRPCDPSVFSKDEMDWFLNLAPVDPSSTLSALEQADLPHEGAQRSRLVNLCMTLAYDADLFPRAVRLVARWLPEACHDDNQERFRRLFQLLASGTQADLAARLGMVRELLCPELSPAHWLGIEALGAMLRAGTFQGFTYQEFGARVWDAGWWPTGDQHAMWYASVLEWVGQQAHGLLRNRLQRSLLAALPGLCAEAGHPAIADGLESAVEKLIVGSRATSEAWAAVKAAASEARADSSQPDSTGAQLAALCRDRLDRLESLLRPTQLIDEVRAYALVDRWRLDDAMAGDLPLTGESRIKIMERLDDQVRELGRELAARLADIDVLLPELVSNSAQAREEALGQGLGEALDPNLCRARWRQMVDAYSVASPDHRRVGFLCGFLAGVAKHDMPLAQEFLDGAVTHPALGQQLPALESSLPIGDQGVRRLIQALRTGAASVRALNVLRIGNATSPMPPAGLATLLEMLADRPIDGLAVAIELLHMRLFSDAQLPDGPAADLLQCGRALLAHAQLGSLATHDLTANGNSVDHVARTCLRNHGLSDASALACTHELARNIKADLARGGWTLGTLLLPALLSAQPVATLDVLLGDPDVLLSTLTGNHGWIDDRYWPAWLNDVPAGELMAWVRRAPAIRAPRVAALCRFEQAKQASSGEPAQPAWSPLAQDLIDACADRLPVLKQFAERLVPMSWRGSRAAIVERRCMLFARYLADTEAPVATWAREFDAKAEREVERLREWDRRQDRQSQSFE